LCKIVQNCDKIQLGLIEGLWVGLKWLGGAGGFCVYNGANWVVELDILRYYDDGLGSWFLNATLIVKGGLGL